MVNKVKVAFLSFVTHSSHLNYGATLHGYAFQKVLDRLGCSNVAINYYPRLVEGDNLKYPILNNEAGRPLFRILVKKLNYILSFFTNIVKYNKFKKFIAHNIRTTEDFYDYKTLSVCKEIKEEPDVFVCESDVIWKYMDGNTFDSNFFLQFPAAKHKRKVAYAPTISSHEFDDSIRQKFIDMVSEFYAISAREEIGANYMGGGNKQEHSMGFRPHAVA